MGQPGIGAMIHYLGGGSKHNPSEFYGRKIAAASMADDKLNIEFADGLKIQLRDEAQSCCEHRYMTTDDDLNKIVGGTLKRIEAKNGPDIDADYDTHEQVFVEIGTDECFVTVVTHNEHNGYYGGFGLTIDTL